MTTKRIKGENGYYTKDPKNRFEEKGTIFNYAGKPTEENIKLWEDRGLKTKIQNGRLFVGRNW